MTKSKFLVQILIGLLVWGCNYKTEVKVGKVQLTNKDSVPAVPIPTVPKELQVSAYLIYGDETISSFDILDNKSEALWNTIIGEGDAEKPSTSTKIIMTGQLDGLKVKILNGKRIEVDEILPVYNGIYVFIIKNTGCEIVNVKVSKQGKTVYENHIDFQCGE